MNEENINIEEVSTWDQYLQIVGKYKNWAFRGHADASWKLWSTISRELQNRHVKPEYWLEQEHRIIWIFQRKISHYLENIPNLADTLRWLALMQHHGAPTRMLDFTWSPYVAAFFALESSTTDAAVWAVNSPKLGTHCFRGDTWEDDWVPSPNEALKRYKVNGLDKVAIGEPFHKNQRLIAQSGTFLCPVDLSKPVEEILGKRKNVIAKIVLCGSSLRKHALSELYSMNISNATLFPDLDGLARSLNYELEYHFQHDPTSID